MCHSRIFSTRRSPLSLSHILRLILRLILGIIHGHLSHLGQCVQMEGPEKLREITEEALLELIKSVAVLSVDPVVPRVKFQSLKQEQGESLHKFIASLKSRASHCEFKVAQTYRCSENCDQDMDKTLTVSYTESMVEGQMIVGLYNPEHRTRIMQDATQYPSFDDKCKMLSALHATDLSTSELETSGSGTAKSAYKSNKKCTECKAPRKRTY